MSWVQWLAARQLLMEEHLGVHLRLQKHAEDEAFRQTAAKLGQK